MVRWGRVAALLLVLACGFLLFDLARRPERQWTARGLVAGIHLYQRTLSPWSSTIGARCRFEPTCSHYAEAVVRRFGAARGTALALGRLARCGPWTAAGTVDPPPESR